VDARARRTAAQARPRLVLAGAAQRVLVEPREHRARAGAHLAARVGERLLDERPHVVSERHERGLGLVAGLRVVGAEQLDVALDAGARVEVDLSAGRGGGDPRARRCEDERCDPP
jgi:hypothetical protein